jgi:RHS repeat-associated protein
MSEHQNNQKKTENNSSLSQLSQERATKSNAIEIPSISLPKGGGAIKGIDEKFQVNAANGTASFSIPLPFSPNRNGFTPQLSLSYNSGVGNGLFGIGWDIDLPSIQRRTDKKLPRYFDTNEVENIATEDSFMFSGVEELVPFMELQNEVWKVKQFEDDTKKFIVRQYRPRIEGSFSRIERIYEKDKNHYYWKVTSKDNITTFFGYNETCRIADPSDESKVFQWLPEFAYDDKGSWVWYEYKEENLDSVSNEVHEKNRFEKVAQFSNKHIKSIKYANQEAKYFENTPYVPSLPNGENCFFEVVFDYGEHDKDNPKIEDNVKWLSRADAFSSYRSCFEMRTYRLCQRVLMFHTFPDTIDDNGNLVKGLNNGVTTLVRSIDFEYKKSSIYGGIKQEEEKNTELTYLIAIEQSGYIKKGQDKYSKKSLPKMIFKYHELTWDKKVKEVNAENLVHAPVGLSGNYQWTDLYNEGINGILTEQANAWFYKSNLGNGEFSQAKMVMPKPSLMGLGNGTLQLQDLDANGEKQLVVNSGGVQGYFELSDDGKWQPFKAFLKNLNLDLKNPNVRMLDVNGDGKPEVVLSDEGAFWFWENEGKIGYDAPELATKPYDEERGAAIVFQDQEQRIFLADMSGDGMTDIVRIRNGEVCYWANMGYGRFAPKVTMSNAPIFDHSDMFNPSYIQLADISGTGATDIIYLGKNEFKAYLNCSGNAWTKGETIEPFFPTEQPNKITVTDLLGNGTACIVWSSEMPAYSAAPMRYIDLMGGKKPHIMVSHENGMGKKTQVEYLSSTHFYLEDKKKGNTWITKLGFPVQVVAKTIVTERVTNVRFTAEYSYHHGYYDHAEREFRGFGRVEQWDTEEFDVFEKTEVSNIVLPAHHQPPVLTKTWFHNGYFLSKDRILDQFKHEYWKNSALGFKDTLDDAYIDLTKVIKELDASEWREAARACKGMTLRQEIFEKEQPDVPYTIATHSCYIQPLQPKAKQAHAVFIALENEAITFSYEKNKEDVRIAHSMNLDINQYAQVRKAVSIVYGRKKKEGGKSEVPDYGLLSDFTYLTDAQQKTHIILTETDFTNDDLTKDAKFYRLPLPYEVKTFECQGVPKPKNQNFFYTVEEIRDWALVAVEQPYEAKPNIQGKRLIEYIQTLYRKNDLSGALGLGKLESLALPYESYQLAFTPSILGTLYGAKLDPTEYENVLKGTGKYEKIDSTNYWISSGKPIFIENGILDLAKVQAAFYLPFGYEDPFENTSTVVYDDYSLYIKSMTDALKNKTEVVTFDYRTLSPTKMKDINENETAVQTDELGMVVAMAILGKNNNSGDVMTSSKFSDKWNFSKLEIDTFFSDPVAKAKDYLGNATACMVYDLDVKPSRVASITREIHGAANTAYQISIEYSDGLGKVALKKIQAEPDMNNVPQWIGNGRTVLNNKGNPIKQYEPYFSNTHDYESEEDAVRNQGVTPILYYDALGRNIRTDLPDGTFTKVKFDAWEQLNFDQIDNTVGHKHTNTPSILYLDSMGRPFFSIADNGTEKYPTYVELDVEGNAHKVIDARNNTVMSYRYDMLGHRLYQDSAEAGERWMLNDCMGKPMLVWDSRDNLFYTHYDKLHRPTELHRVDAPNVLQNFAPQTWDILEKMEYGTNASIAKNLNGVLVKHYDGSGLIEIIENDFKGNTLKSTKQFVEVHSKMPIWGNTPTTLLAPEIWTTETKYDALNRPIEKIEPYSNPNPKNTIIHTFNKSGQLKTVSHNGKAIVEDILYNAKGQRLSIALGNQTKTTYTYDDKTFRLISLKTFNNSNLNNAVHQDLLHTYDPVGNIIEIEDKAAPTIFYSNQAVQPINKYTYDALYRLIEAEGRESIGQSIFWTADSKEIIAKMGQPNPNSNNAAQKYTQTYTYDGVGNILKMVHQAANSGYTRFYQYATKSNRLVATGKGSSLLSSLSDHYNDNPTLADLYEYDTHGSMTKMGNVSTSPMIWDCHDMIQEYDLGGGGTAYYQYDSQKQRTRKVITNRNGKIKEERLYLGSFEVFREYDNKEQVIFERETLHVMDDKQRVAMLETRTKGNDNSLIKLMRYLYANHLGSSTLELNEVAAVISYEEYHPYGTTAYYAQDKSIKAVAKRYRYTGMERDEETGFAYHTARYYLPWLGRWASADPIGIEGGLNNYCYCSNNPINRIDKNGKIDWGTTAKIAGVIAIGIAVTVLTAGIGTVILGAATATLTGGALTTATTLGAVAITGISGGLGNMASTAMSNNTINQEKASLGSAFVSGFVGGVATLGTGAVAGHLAKGVNTFKTVATSTSGLGIAGRALGRGVQGFISGAAGGAAQETTRQLASGEALNKNKIGENTLVGGAFGAATNTVLGPLLQKAGKSLFDFGRGLRSNSKASLPFAAKKVIRQSLSEISAEMENHAQTKINRGAALSNKQVKYMAVQATAISECTGKTYSGKNGEISLGPATDTEPVIMKQNGVPRPCAQCAENAAIVRGINNGEKISDLQTISAIDPFTNSPIPACPNCQLQFPNANFTSGRAVK